MPTIKELYEKRASVVEKQKEFVNRAEEESRNLNEDEVKQFDEFEKEFNQLNDNIRIKEAAEQKEKEMAEAAYSKGKSKDNYTEQKQSDSERYSKAFKKYLMKGIGRLQSEDPEDAQIIRQGFVNQDGEKRALTVGTDSTGGFLVPEGFQAELERAMLRFGGMRQAARVINTDSGNDVPWPNVNDTTNKGAILAENTQVGTQDTSYGSITLKAYKYTSKEILVPRELIQDSAFNMDTHLRDILSERIGRILNEHFTTGNNSDKPQGVVTGAVEGVAAGGDAIDRNELLDLLHSVDPAYRVRRTGGPHVGFMFNDNTLKVIKKLALGSSDARPLWQPSMREGEPDMLEGYPYIINQDMADIAAGEKSILFGDFAKYIIRDVMNMMIMRLDERHAESFQFAFLGFSRHDGRILDAGTNPIKYLTNATS